MSKKYVFAESNDRFKSAVTRKIFRWMFAVLSLTGAVKLNAREKLPTVKIDTIVANKRADFSRGGGYNQLDNSIFLTYYVLENIPSIWNDKHALDEITKHSNASIPFTLEHEMDHARVEQISKFGFSSSQIIQFNILREVSAQVAEMLKARAALIETGDIERAFDGLKSSYVVIDNFKDGYMNGISLYYEWLKRRGGKINPIPDAEESNTILTAAAKAFLQRFPESYAADIAKLSVRDMRFYDGLNIQKMTMPPEDFDLYIGRMKIEYMRGLARKDPVAYDAAVRAMFTYGDICLIDKCDAEAIGLLRESVLKMMSNRTLKKQCGKYNFDEGVAEAFRRQRNMDFAKFDFAPIQIKHEYHIQGIER